MVRWRAAAVDLILGLDRNGTDGEPLAGLDRHPLLGQARSAHEGAVERAEVAQHQQPVRLGHLAMPAAHERMVKDDVCRAAAANDGGQSQIELASFHVAVHNEQFCLHVPYRIVTLIRGHAVW